MSQPEAPRRPSPPVPYPAGCRCSHLEPEPCASWATTHARRKGRKGPPRPRCLCKCHTMRPSPWDWHGDFDK